MEGVHVNPSPNGVGVIVSERQARRPRAKDPLISRVQAQETDQNVGMSSSSNTFTRTQPVKRVGKSIRSETGKRHRRGEGREVDGVGERQGHLDADTSGRERIGVKEGGDGAGQLTPGEGRMLHTSKKGQTFKSANICKSCKTKFPSSEALDIHTKMKLKALSKVRIEKKDFLPASQLLVCHFVDCCYTSDSLENMSRHFQSGKHGTRKHLLSSGELEQNGKKIEVSRAYVIQRGPLSAAAGPTTCPTCQQHLSTGKALAKHVKYGCRGMSVWNCPHCALQCKSMSSLHKHMGARHPLPPSLNLTGVFKGRTKIRKVAGEDRYDTRKGEIKAGVDTRSIQAFTFLSKKANTLTAEEMFTGEQKKNLLFLIDRAKGGNGAFTLNINTTSLLFTSNSRKLEMFPTQSKAMAFSSTVKSTHVFDQVLLAVNMAARQVADASSGLSLHTIKSCTLTFAAKSGHRGAGEKKKNSPFTTRNDWAGGKQIRGCVSVQLTPEDIVNDKQCESKCFQQAIVHNVFHKDLAEKLRKRQETFCSTDSHPRAEGASMCDKCRRLWERDTENVVSRRGGSYKPHITMTASYREYVERFDWRGIDFPAGTDPL